MVNWRLYFWAISRNILVIALSDSAGGATVTGSIWPEEEREPLLAGIGIGAVVECRGDSGDSAAAADMGVLMIKI